MTDLIINDTTRLRTIESTARICLGVRFGIEMIYETHRISYIPFDGQGKLCSGRGYYATYSFKEKLWTLTDDLHTKSLTFPDRSAMTKWVKRNINQ